MCVCVCAGVCGWPSLRLHSKACVGGGASSLCGSLPARDVIKGVGVTKLNRHGTHFPPCCVGRYGRPCTAAAVDEFLDTHYLAEAAHGLRILQYTTAAALRGRVASDHVWRRAASSRRGQHAKQARLHFHQCCGKGVSMSAGSLSATRREEVNAGGVCFGHLPVAATPDSGTRGYTLRVGPRVGAPSHGPAVALQDRPSHGPAVAVGFITTAPSAIGGLPPSARHLPNAWICLDTKVLHAGKTFSPCSFGNDAPGTGDAAAGRGSLAGLRPGDSVAVSLEASGVFRVAVNGAEVCCTRTGVHPGTPAFPVIDLRADGIKLSFEDSLGVVESVPGGHLFQPPVGLDDGAELLLPASAAGMEAAGDHAAVDHGAVTPMSIAAEWNLDMTIALAEHALAVVRCPVPGLLGWAGLGWAGLGWAGLCWAGICAWARRRPQLGPPLGCPPPMLAVHPPTQDEALTASRSPACARPTPPLCRCCRCRAW